MKRPVTYSEKNRLHSTLNFSEMEGSREIVNLCMVYVFI